MEATIQKAIAVLDRNKGRITADERDAQSRTIKLEEVKLKPFDDAHRNKNDHDEGSRTGASHLGILPGRERWRRCTHQGGEEDGGHAEEGDAPDHPVCGQGQHGGVQQE